MFSLATFISANYYNLSRAFFEFFSLLSNMLVQFTDLMSHLSIYNDRHKEAFAEVYVPKKICARIFKPHL